jgi:hypothetical protein
VIDQGMLVLYLALAVETCVFSLRFPLGPTRALDQANRVLCQWCVSGKVNRPAE